MKRIINTILIAGFILLIAAAVLPFVADLKYKQAKMLKENYRWEKADRAYQQVVRLDPFNAEHFAEYGYFLMRQGQHHKDKTSWFKRAETLYKESCRLNPEHAEYRFLLGEIKLQLNDLSGLNDFRIVVGLDPYNFRMNYFIGHSLISIWPSLNKEGKDFALERLSYVLRSKSHYAEYIYPVIIRYTKHFSLTEKVTPETYSSYEKLYRFMKKRNLWQFRKRVAKQLDFYKQKEHPDELEQEKLARTEKIKELKKKKEASNSILPGDWQGESKGGHVYKNGNMYSEGKVDALIRIPKGKSTVYIRVKGSPADDIFPYTVLKLDGEEVGEMFVESTEWKEYFFPVNTDGGIKVLSVTFVNDGINEEKGEDRNLYVGEVRVRE